MAPIGKLNGPLPTFRSYKARIVAKYLGLELETTPEFQMGVDNKTPEYLAKFPCGKVPTYDGADGFTLTDSSTIAYYVASKAGGDSPLLGKTAEETAEILQYILFAEADFTPAVLGVLAPLLGFHPYIQPAFQAAEKDMARFLDALNNMLVDKTYLVGERLTVADIIVACDLIMSFKLYLTAADRKTYRNIARYFKTITGQAAFKAVVGDIELCTTRIERKAEPAKKKEKKADKPKAQPKAQPKAEKKKAAPKEDDDEEDDMPAPAPKPKSKLDLLPKPSMNLNEWKRVYSNEDTREVAMPWLWKNFDAEGYSLWKVEYNYNSELTKLFMTNNLIGGFFIRMEAARKYAFGTLLTLGAENDNMIWGYFMVRGKVIPEEITDTPDFASYTWTAADISDDKVRAEIEDAFAWEGSSLPRECYDGKVYN